VIFGEMAEAPLHVTVIVDTEPRTEKLRGPRPPQPTNAINENKQE
jgi:hypothetical protein